MLKKSEMCPLRIVTSKFLKTINCCLFRNKLSFLREKELKRGYDILSLNSYFQEPRRERKISYVQQIVPEKDRTSLDGYKPSVFSSVWDKINKSEDKRGR